MLAKLLLSSFILAGSTPLKDSKNYTVKSNYEYHSGWVEVGYDDTVLLTTIYSEANDLIREAKTNIQINSISCNIDGEKLNFNNLDTIKTEFDEYVNYRVINPNFYSNFKFSGDEKYSWDWWDACPQYIWDWNYQNGNENIKILSHKRVGYGKSDINIYFYFSMSWND